ncbi:MAG: TIGR00282 family metallophosphoesterase [Boseongicola sp.]|nr:TIGR00282 family metallophosphoesterase [Boseongicola sp.]MYH57259.1 YmdB family metallophosphoesterase [Boseongicola sp. SB0675_bin_26]
MKILYLGDVMGRSGRTAVVERLGELRARLQADFVVVNCENATSGLGASPEHAASLLEAGADVLTLGDHAFDQREMLSGIEREPRILRPLNFSKAAPGAGAKVFDAGSGRKVLVAQVLGQVFMNRPYDNPFSAIDKILNRFPLGGAVHASLVDIHCEATSEKMAMGHFCDGRASAVLGSHTHVPTADTMILPGGTAYMTDAGMCGDYNSVIGMGKEEPLSRFVTGMRKRRFQAAQGEATLCGALVTTDDDTGKALDLTPVRDGGVLAPPL